MKTALPMFILLLPVHIFATSDCPSFKQALQIAETSSNKLSGINAACFCKILSDAPTTAAAVSLITTYASENRIPDTLLLSVYATAPLRNNTSLFITLRNLWKQKNPFVAQRIQQLQRAGAFRTADTLYRILDYQSSADPHLLLRWIELKNILAASAEIPELVCRIIETEQELLPPALDQFTRIIDELPLQEVQPLLESFYHCCDRLSSTKVACIGWILDRYSEKQLFSVQLPIIENAVRDKQQQVERFSMIASNAFSAQYYPDAIAAARRAYSATSDTLQKKELAALLYAAFSQLGKNDSAKIWFGRTDPAGVAGDPFTAIDAYITMGDYSKARTLLTSRSSSFIRDTLYLRLLLCTDSAQTAFSYASNAALPLAKTPYAKTWQIRTALFTKNFATCKTLLDSLHLRPSDPYAADLITYRYWISRLVSTPEDLAKFSQIEYTLYIGRRDRAAALICSSTISPENRWRLAVYTARKQLAHGENGAAAATLRCAPEEREPEYLFCLADALYRTGDTATAQRLLERILVEFSSGMYTAQARLLLSRIGK